MHVCGPIIKTTDLLTFVWVERGKIILSLYILSKRITQNGLLLETILLLLQIDSPQKLSGRLSSPLVRGAFKK